MLDSVFCSWRNLKRYRRRTILTAASMAIGVSAIVLTVHIGLAGKMFLNNEMSSMGLDGLFLGVKEGSGAVYTAHDLHFIEKQDAVQAATPIVSAYTKIKMRKHSAKAMVWGIGKQASKVVDLQLLYGRLLNAGDIRGAANVCVVDEKTALRFYKRSNIVGKSVTVQWNGKSTPFQIVGVVSSGGSIFQNIVGDYVPNFLYIPYTTAERMAQKHGFDQIAVKLNGAEKGNGFEQQLKTVWKRIKATPDQYTVQHMARQQKTLNSIVNGTTAVVTVIAAISFLVASFGMMTIMMISVKERTKEIGIKKAIGASRIDILLEFLMESFTISLIGSIMGCIVSVLALAVLCLWFEHISIHFLFLAGCILFSTVVGTVFGIIPSYQASKLEPVVALRYE